MLEIKAKMVLGTGRKVSGRIEVFENKGKEIPSFEDLKVSLEKKILICSNKLSKIVLEKARALGVLGIVAREISDEDLLRLKKELKMSWGTFSFALLITEKEIDLDKVRGKMGIIDVEEKKLIVA